NHDMPLQQNVFHRYQYNDCNHVAARTLSQPILVDLIISFVDPTDISTLHSICLVNRLWCRRAIPHLWSSPFSLNVRNDHLLDIVSIYVSCLDESSQRSLLQLHIKNHYMGNSYVDPHMRSSRIDSQ
ncbi:15223_t:CDS:1, partial [Acaulospora morrowiae]